MAVLHLSEVNTCGAHFSQRPWLALGDGLGVIGSAHHVNAWGTAYSCALVFHAMTNSRKPLVVRRCKGFPMFLESSVVGNTTLHHTYGFLVIP